MFQGIPVMVIYLKISRVLEFLLKQEKMSNYKCYGMLRIMRNNTKNDTHFLHSHSKLFTKDAIFLLTICMLGNSLSFHWRSSHYAVTHVGNKKVTFKGGHLMW